MIPSTLTEITPTNPSDLEDIFRLFEHSIEYQERNGYPSWRNYDRTAVIRDVESGNQYKVLIDATLALVFTVRYHDKDIWGERDLGTSVYLHRIVVNPAFKGRRLFGTVLDWSIEHARQKGFDTVRLDTWTNNPPLIAYYSGFGFNVIDSVITPDSPELPAHNRKLALTLLEYRVANPDGQ